MFNVRVKHQGAVTVLQCEGRLVRSDAAYHLRHMMAAHVEAHVIVLDLSALDALEGGGLGMLVFLRRWTRDNGVNLKLFNPRGNLRRRLERAHLKGYFEIISESEFLSLVDYGETRPSMTCSLVA